MRTLAAALLGYIVLSGGSCSGKQEEEAQRSLAERSPVPPTKRILDLHSVIAPIGKVPADALPLPPLFARTWASLNELRDELLDAPLGSGPKFGPDAAMEENLGGGKTVVLDSKLAVTGAAVLYHARMFEAGILMHTIPIPGPTSNRNLPNKLVVKYQTDCSEYPLQQEHPLVAEFKYQRVVFQASGIVPAILFISAPSEAPPGGEEIDMKFFLGSDCENARNPHPNVRFVVMELAGPSLASVIGNRTLLPTMFVFRVFLRGVQLLEQLHSLGLIHGDVHAGNLAFRSADSAVNEDGVAQDLILIDLGRAKFFTYDKSKIQTNDKVDLLSPWERRGAVKAPRDDLIRLFDLFTFAFDVDFPDYVALKGFKRWQSVLPSFLLDRTGHWDPLRPLQLAEGAQREAFVVEFKILISHLVSVQETEIPNYSAIKATVVRLLGILQKDGEVGAVRPHDQDLFEWKEEDDVSTTDEHEITD